MKKTNNKGITLIALVITIIVLLILAGVSIAMLTGENGILGKANTAKTTNDEAKAKEQIQIAVMGSYGDDGKLKYDGLKKNLEDIGITGLPDETSYPLEVTLDGVIATIKANGEVEFQTSGGFTQTGDTITSPTGKTIKVGDYVNYDPTLGANASDLEYSSPASKTGADSDQDFNATTYKNAGYGWRVLGVKNGKLRLISEEYVGAGTYSDERRTLYTLKGQNGYINGIDELKTISAIFGHGKGAESATSITVDDINAITGYNPTTAKYEKGEFNEYGNKVTYTRWKGSALSSSGTNGKTWSGNESTFNYYNKATKTFVPLTSGSTQLTSTAYWYNPASLTSGQLVQPLPGVDENGTYNEVNQMLFGKWTVKVTSESRYFGRNFTGKGTEPLYWVASNYTGTHDGVLNFGLFCVQSGEVGNFYIYGNLFYSYGRSLCQLYGVRPVVQLKTDIQLEWNNTANEWKIK